MGGLKRVLDFKKKWRLFIRLKRVRSIFPWLGEVGLGEVDSVVLDRSAVYILPNRHGMLFFFVFFIMLLASLNDNLNLGLALTFLLIAVLVVSIFHTFQNLSGVRVFFQGAKPVFAGGVAYFNIGLECRDGLERLGLCLSSNHSIEPSPSVDLKDHKNSVLPIKVVAEKRGIVRLGRFSLSTRYPLGLITAWSWIDLKADCLVYPKPEPVSHTQPPQFGSDDLAEQHVREGEDFVGLRAYQEGDSPRKIHWKASARRDTLVSKLFAGQPVHPVWFEWERLQGLDTEARLSRLCRWIVDAHQANQVYGLRIPGHVFPPHRGQSHQKRCLTALALFSGS